MRVSVEKMDGVRAVKVSLNEGRAVVDLEAGNTITLAAVREQVRRNGFTPQGATVTVRARVTAAGDHMRLEVPETKETFDVATTTEPARLAELRKQLGQVVTVDGVIAAQKEKTAATIQITAVKAGSGKPGAW